MNAKELIESVVEATPDKEWSRIKNYAKSLETAAKKLSAATKSMNFEDAEMAVDSILSNAKLVSVRLNKIG